MKRWVFSDDSQGDSSRQVLVTLADPDPEAGTPERIDVACRGAQWETWSRPLAIAYTDHDPGSVPSRYMGADRTYVNESGRVLAVDGVAAQAIIHALTEVYLSEGPTGDADYVAARSVVLALGGAVPDA